jgi:hypothetical protein
MMMDVPMETLDERIIPREKEMSIGIINLEEKDQNSNLEEKGQTFNKEEKGQSSNLEEIEVAIMRPRTTSDGMIEHRDGAEQEVNVVHVRIVVLEKDLVVNRVDSAEEKMARKEVDIEPRDPREIRFRSLPSLPLPHLSEISPLM